jgi:MFS family permease
MHLPFDRREPSESSLLTAIRYKRGEFGIRAAIFFSAAALAGSFGGLLAAAIATMDGVGGKPGWAWIFILEGLATILIATASFWMVWSALLDIVRFANSVVGT